MRFLTAGLAALSLGACTARAAPTVLHVTLGAALSAPVSGRLLVFAKPLGQTDPAPSAVDAGQFDPRETAIAAQEVHDLAPGSSVDIDADVTAFPQPFSHLKPGRYAVQAVLDRDHTYAYSGRGPGDIVSGVAAMDLPGGGAITLATIVPDRDPYAFLARGSEAVKTAYAAAKADVRPLDYVSPALTRFWGRPIHMRGWVVTPPGYDAQPGKRYPTVYYTHGFGGYWVYLYGTAVARWREMKAGEAPPMIWVILDESSPTGTHEFADSVNNGPWGQALTGDLIPELEHQYRMDAKPSGRFLTGHSSGGWAALWLQVRYAALFGGSWPTSPDPSDFHDWTGVDLYAPGVNVYRRPDGSARPLIRDKGRVVGSIEDFTRLEAVLGDYGGQEASFDWVFSPRGPDGRPVPMFDRITGQADPAVIAYWRDHFDIAERFRRHWPEMKRDLDGKIHLTVGTADTFYLDGSAHLLEATMKSVGAKTDFHYLDGRTHFDLYLIGSDPQGLAKAIAWRMYAIARPGSKPPAE
jgi:S-formylglutathione hydrolase FrmB